MSNCPVCGSAESKMEYVCEVFQIDGKPILVENIPATVCQRCGEATFSRKTAEEVRQLVQDGEKPLKTLSMDVFLFRKNDPSGPQQSKQVFTDT
mgnify:FL=1